MSVWQRAKDWFKRVWNVGEDYIEIPPQKSVQDDKVDIKVDKGEDIDK